MLCCAVSCCVVSRLLSVKAETRKPLFRVKNSALRSQTAVVNRGAECDGSVKTCGSTDWQPVAFTFKEEKQHCQSCVCVCLTVVLIWWSLEHPQVIRKSQPPQLFIDNAKTPTFCHVMVNK